MNDPPNPSDPREGEGQGVGADRFAAREYLYGDRESWEVWDLLHDEIAEPLGEHTNLSQSEADRRTDHLNRRLPHVP